MCLLVLAVAGRSSWAAERAESHRGRRWGCGDVGDTGAVVATVGTPSGCGGVGTKVAVGGDTTTRVEGCECGFRRRTEAMLVRGRAA